MNYNTFITSIKSGFPPAKLTNPELAMWHAMNDNWEPGFMSTFTGQKETLNMKITGTDVRTDRHLRIS